MSTIPTLNPTCRSVTASVIVSLTTAIYLFVASPAGAAPADVPPIEGFEKGVLVTVSRNETDAVLAELLMPEDRVGEGYGRIKNGFCPAAAQPHSEVLCDYPETLGLALFTKGDDHSIDIQLTYAEPGWTIRFTLTPKADEPAMHLGRAAFVKGTPDEDPVATIPVHAAIGFITLKLTRERFTSQ